MSIKSFVAYVKTLMEVNTEPTAHQRKTMMDEFDKLSSGEKKLGRLWLEGIHQKFYNTEKTSEAIKQTEQEEYNATLEEARQRHGKDVDVILPPMRQ